MLNGVSKEADIIKRAKELGMSAIALTDLGALHGAIDFYDHALSAGVKPLIGVDLYTIIENVNDEKNAGKRDSSVRQTFIAKNNKGYRALCVLSSKGFDEENFRYNPRVPIIDCERYAKDLIVFSGSLDGPVGHAFLYKNQSCAREVLVRFKKKFGDNFYSEIVRLEMSRQQMEEDGFDRSKQITYDLYIKQQIEFNAWLIKESEILGIELVATNDVFYINRDEWVLRDLLLNVSTHTEMMFLDDEGNNIPNPKRRMAESHENFLMHEDDMQKKFSDIPNALHNTLKIAEMCNVEIDLETKHYPVYKPDIAYSSEQERIDIVEKMLLEECRDNVKNKYKGINLHRLQEHFPGEDVFEKIEERIDFEFSVLQEKKICDYIMVVKDFIQWSKKNNIPVGPGRGSGVGSIILYLLDITTLDPLQLDLFFERFINPERPSYPDIDVDVCMDNRQAVIEYMSRRYNRENISHIVTYGTMKSRMAIRDVGRVLSINIKEVNRIVAMIPDQLGITIQESLESSADLRDEYEHNQSIRSLIDYSMKLEGCVRNTGIHAAGILVSAVPIVECIPTFQAKDAKILISQFSMKPAESVGMLKIDILGLRTLTVIQSALNRIYEEHRKEIDVEDIDLDDPETFELLRSGKTTGVFQLESRGMQELLRRFKPDRFADIIAVISLYRPGPLDMIPSFIKRKHGEEPIVYMHEDLKEILQNTYGIIVYQEQVIKISSVIAGYSKGEGDILRRAMGKKDESVMMKQREGFCRRSIDRGYNKNIVEKIFDQMAKFAAYGFNKSHAAAYAKISLITAYIKAKYQGLWIEVLLTTCMNDKDKIYSIITEAQSLGFTFKCPSINESHSLRFHHQESTIMYPLVAIKGVGNIPSNHIVEIRKEHGLFKSIEDFIDRVSIKIVGEKLIITLIQAGCFDEFGSRAGLIEFIKSEITGLIKRKKHNELGEMLLFSSCIAEVKDDISSKRNTHLDLIEEKFLLGDFISRNPIIDIVSKINSRGNSVERLSSFFTNETIESTKQYNVISFIESIKVMTSDRTGKNFAKIVVSDSESVHSVFLWSDDYERVKSNISENSFCIMRSSKKIRNDILTLTCRSMVSIHNSISIEDAFSLLYGPDKNRRTLTMATKKSVVSILLEETSMNNILKLKGCLSPKDKDNSEEIVIRVYAKTEADPILWEAKRYMNVLLLNRRNIKGVRHNIIDIKSTV